MRENVAKLVAVGTGLVVVAAVVLFAVVQQRTEDPVADPAAGAPPERVADREVAADAADPHVPAAAVQEIPVEVLDLGRRVYREERCARCHSIAGEGSPRSPLDGVGDRLTLEEIRLWIVAPQEMRPRVRKPAYDLPEEELDALVAYMASLTEPEG